MKKLTSTFLVVITLFVSIVHAQNFEGKIVYHNSYKVKANVTSQLSDMQIDSMMGKVNTYATNGIAYKNTFNGSLMQWEIYIRKENKIYTKTSESDTVFWNNADINSDGFIIDSVLKTELNKNAAQVLGYQCDELILTCKSGVKKYYFNSKFSVDAKNYVNHKFGNWYDYLKIAKALPLKMIIETEGWVLTSTATEVTPMKLDDNEFRISAGTKVSKSLN